MSFFAEGSRRTGRIAMWAGLVVLSAVLWSIGGATQGSRTAILIDIDGAIGPAITDYVSRGLAHANEQNAGLVIIRMDTPGGLVSSTRVMIRDILASPVPVAVYVAPGGARAASAGTYIAYAAHVAAMAPGTHIGAATPVQMGGGGLPFGRDDRDEESQNGDDDGEPAQRQSPRNAAEAKAVNDAVAYIRGLADLRGRNAEWAEEAVRQASSLSATAAADRNVVDFIARDLNDLLAQAHGRSVELDGTPLELDTVDLRIEEFAPDWRTRILATITDPNIALIFMMIGIYGLIFEFMNPGALVPGTIGGICLLIGLYSLAVLPVSYAGVGLIVLGIALMVAEAFAPSFGILGVGGAVAFVLGAAILMDPGVPGFEISLPLVMAIAAVTLAFSLVVVRMAMTSHRRAVVTGRDQMQGAPARVLDWAGGRGHVMIHGERWRAVGSEEFSIGQSVTVTAIDGLTLHVTQAPDEAIQGRQQL